MAKIYWSITARQQPKANQLFHDPPWSISVQGKVEACFNTAALYDYTYGRTESVPYWQEDRQPFPEDHEHTIAWSAITKASQLWPWGKTKWQTKLWTGFAPVRRVLKRRREWSHDLFPQCFKKNETCLHVLQCPADSARTQ